jgi:hypothetical protein
MKMSLYRLCIAAFGFFLLVAGTGCGSGGDAEHATKASASALIASGISTADLQLKVSKNACATNVAQDYFQVTNAGSTAIPASQISIKYWVNDLSGVPIVPHVWYGGCITAANGTCTHPISGATATAERFTACGPDAAHQANWEITVTNTDPTPIAPGMSWSGVQTAINLATYAPFTPGSGTWFSGCGSGQPFVTDPSFGLYLNGSLVFANGLSGPICRAPHGSQQLGGYFGAPPNPTVAQVLGPVPGDTRVSLDIGLPVRDAAGLQAFIDGASNPDSPTYRKYLSVSDFAQQFGAAPSDYQALLDWARGKGFAIEATFPNNLLVTVSASAATIEQALFTNLVYRQRADASRFLATDREPSLDLSTSVLRISGLSDYFAPVRKDLNGSGPGFSYWGADLRAAYLGVGSTCQNLDGTGQVVGILADDTFNTADLTQYENAQSPPYPAGNASVIVVGTPPAFAPGSSLDGRTEVALDVEMVNAVAPGAQILVFQGSFGITAHGDSILHAMATNGSLTVASNSWSFGWNENAEQAISEMAAEGISMFDASGDHGNAHDDDDHTPEFQNQTLVGGTVLSTQALSATSPAVVYPSPYYANESAWPDSGGGILNGDDKDCWPWPFCDSAPRGIPGYQANVDMSTNGGSTQFRNSPDVASVAQDVGLVVDGGKTSTGGTSAAAPLWAGFIALANQQSENNGLGRVGFLNPVLYAIGLTSTQPAPNAYSASFNDITAGKNNGFSAVAGYDLVTGWGTPKCGLITQLSSSSPSSSPPATFSELELTIATGGDDLRDDSEAQAQLFLRGNGAPFQTVELKAQGAPTWFGGSVHTLIVPLNMPVAPEDLGAIAVSLIEHDNFPETDDNWNIELMDVRFVSPGGPQICFVNESGDPAARLTGSAPSFNFIASDGCSSGPAVPPGTPPSTIEFMVSTGGDDLRSDSEAKALLFAPGQSSAFQTIELKAQDAGSFGGATTQDLQFALTSSQPIDHIVIQLVEHDSFPEGDDNWNIEGLEVRTWTPGNPENCLIEFSGDPGVRLTGSAGSVTLVPRAGCI